MPLQTTSITTTKASLWPINRTLTERQWPCNCFWRRSANYRPSKSGHGSCSKNHQQPQSKSKYENTKIIDFFGELAKDTITAINLSGQMPKWQQLVWHHYILQLLIDVARNSQPISSIQIVKTQADQRAENLDKIWAAVQKEVCNQLRWQTYHWWASLHLLEDIWKCRRLLLKVIRTDGGHHWQLHLIQKQTIWPWTTSRRIFQFQLTT